MAVEAATLAYELRLIQEIDFGVPDDGLRGRLDRLIGVCSQVAKDRTEDAPEILLDEATIMMAKYIHDRPNVTTLQYADAFQNSGAAALLSSYTPQRAIGGRSIRQSS